MIESKPIIDSVHVVVDGSAKTINCRLQTYGSGQDARIILGPKDPVRRPVAVMVAMERAEDEDHVMYVTDMGLVEFLNVVESITGKRKKPDNLMLVKADENWRHQVAGGLLKGSVFIDADISREDIRLFAEEHP